MIVTISGASGVGKSTVMQALLECIPDSQPLVSCTTRPPRPTDLPNEYRYFSEKEFDAEIEAKQFLWIGEAHGFRYGRHRSMIARALASDQLHFVGTMSIDALTSLLSFADTLNQRGTIHSFYLFAPPEPILRKRLMQRGDDPQSIEGRLADCRSWDDEARITDVPYFSIPDMPDIMDKVQLVMNCLAL